MAFILLLFKASSIEEKRQQYEDEKLNSIRIEKGELPVESFSQKCRHFRVRLKRRIRNLFIPKFVRRFWLNMRNEKSFLNFLWKSFLGFICGFLLTYVFFMFFIFQLSFSLVTSTIICCFLGIYLTLGLAFSHRIRCLVLMILPQFFSNVGRYALIGYAFVLILSGPAKNTLYNVGVLTESMACGQEQLKAGVEQMKEAVKKPFVSMKDALQNMVENVKRVAQNVKESLLAVIRIVMNIVRIIQSAMSWLSSIVNVCNKSMGTPSERCHRALENGVQDCRARLGPYFSWLCNVTYVAKVACEVAKAVDYMCMLVQFVSGAFIQNVKRKIRSFANHIHTMLYVEVSVRRYWEFSGESSKSASDIAASVANELKERSNRVLTVLTTLATCASPLVLFIVARVKYYQYMYEKSDRYDNRYITPQFIQLELARARSERDTILPLNRRERGQYIRTTSFRLVARERLNLARSMIFLAITTFKLLVHLITDYSLYWILATVRKHAKNTNLMPPRGRVEVVASGGGWWGSAVQESVDSLMTATPKPSYTIHCLPDPSHPDYTRYFQIGFLLSLLWICALLEPYGLRLRHVFMDFYRPMRAMTRAQALYSRILNRRGGFLKYARRKLHRDHKLQQEEKITFKDWLSSVIPCWWLRWLLGVDSGSRVRCLLCGVTSTEEELIHCPTPGCVGVFCTKCFADLKNLCSICLKPSQYGDISDVSEEQDSSDDPNGERGDLNRDVEARFFANKKNERFPKSAIYPKKSFVRRMIPRWSKAKKSLQDEEELRLNLLDSVESSSSEQTTFQNEAEATLAESNRRYKYGQDNKKIWRQEGPKERCPQQVKGNKAPWRLDGKMAWTADSTVYTIFKRSEKGRETKCGVSSKEAHQALHLQKAKKAVRHKYEPKKNKYRPPFSTDSESEIENAKRKNHKYEPKSVEFDIKAKNDSKLSYGDHGLAENLNCRKTKLKRRKKIGDHKTPKSSFEGSSNNDSLNSKPGQKGQNKSTAKTKQISADGHIKHHNFGVESVQHKSLSQISQTSNNDENSDCDTSTNDQTAECEKPPTHSKASKFIETKTESQKNKSCRKSLKQNTTESVLQRAKCLIKQKTFSGESKTSSGGETFHKKKDSRHAERAGNAESIRKKQKRAESPEPQSLSESDHLDIEKSEIQSSQNSAKSLHSEGSSCKFRCKNIDPKRQCPKKQCPTKESPSCSALKQPDLPKMVCNKDDKSHLMGILDEEIANEKSVATIGTNYDKNQFALKTRDDESHNFHKSTTNVDLGVSETDSSSKSNVARSTCRLKPCCSKNERRICKRKDLKKDGKKNKYNVCKTKDTAQDNPLIEPSDASYFVKTSLGDKNATVLRNREDRLAEELYKMELGKSDGPQRCLRLDDVTEYLDTLAAKYGDETRKFYVEKRQMKDNPKWVRDYKWDGQLSLPTCLCPEMECMCGEQGPSTSAAINCASRCNRYTGKQPNATIIRKKTADECSEGIMSKILSPFKKMKRKMKKRKVEKCACGGNCNNDATTCTAKCLESCNNDATTCTAKSLESCNNDATTCTSQCLVASTKCGTVTSGDINSESDDESSTSESSESSSDVTTTANTITSECDRTKAESRSNIAKPIRAREDCQQRPIRPNNCDASTCTYSTKATATDARERRRVVIQEPRITSSTTDCDSKWQDFKQDFNEQLDSMKRTCQHIATTQKSQKKC